MARAVSDNIQDGLGRIILALSTLVRYCTAHFPRFTFTINTQRRWMIDGSRPVSHMEYETDNLYGLTFFSK
jgi:hypothetical protein